MVEYGMPLADMRQSAVQWHKDCAKRLWQKAWDCADLPEMSRTYSVLARRREDRANKVEKCTALQLIHEYHLVAIERKDNPCLVSR